MAVATSTMTQAEEIDTMKVYVKRAVQAVIAPLWLLSSALPISAQAEQVEQGRASAELTRPAPEDAGTQPACRTTREYVKLMNLGNYTDIAPLFAENAVHYGPDGITRRGRQAISDFYTSSFKTGGPKVWAISYVADGNHCVVQLAGGDRKPGAPVALGAIDHMTVDDQGRIEQFIMYYSPAEAMPVGHPARKECGAGHGH